MMDERDDATELEIELAEEVGRLLLRDPAHPAWSDERFLDWLAADAREGARHANRRAMAVVEKRGEAIMARAQARLLRVQQRGRPPLLKGTQREHGSRAVAVVELGI